MAEDLSQLTKHWLFKARMERGEGENTRQKEWLWQQYQAIERDGLGEVTSHSFAGQSGSTQYRGASPQDNLLAIQAAIEHLEALIAGGVAASFSRPFGFRFKGAPADILG